MNGLKWFDIDMNLEGTMSESFISMVDYKIVDHLKIFQSILLRRLQPEQINSVVNMMYTTRPSATKNERERAVVSQFF